MGQLNSQRRLGWLVALLLGPVLVAGGEEPAGEPGEIGILIEPRYAAGAVFHEINGARETVLVPARRTRYGVDAFSEREWQEAGLDWPAVFLAARRQAERLSKAMEIEWVRDERDVIIYAEIVSEEPFIGSVVFADSFLDRFRTTLGREVLVTIPERNRIFVFPRHGGRLSEFAPAIAARHRESGIPVSLELFLVDGSGVRVIGKVSS